MGNEFLSTSSIIKIKTNILEIIMIDKGKNMLSKKGEDFIMKSTTKAFVLGVVLTAVMCTSGIALASNGYFRDGGWWTPAAEWTKDQGLMTGIQDNYFGGDQAVTRGQLAQVLKNLSDTGAITINKPGSPTATPTPAPAATPTPTPVATPAATPAPIATSGITMDNYDKIQKGMTLAQVEAILGEPGKKTYSFVSDSFTHFTYEWKNGNATIDVEIYDGKVNGMNAVGF
jgi:hypothetical protein